MTFVIFLTGFQRIIDFGTTELIKCFGKSINIKHFDWRLLSKNKNDKNCYNISKFNPCLDVQNFFYHLSKYGTSLILKSYKMLCKKLGKDKVTIEHIFSHPDIQQFMLSINRKRRNEYKFRLLSNIINK